MNTVQSVTIEWGTAFDPQWECPEVIPPRYPQKRNSITYVYTDKTSKRVCCNDDVAEATLMVLMELGYKNQRATKGEEITIGKETAVIEDTEEPVIQEFVIQ